MPKSWSANWKQPLRDCTPAKPLVSTAASINAEMLRQSHVAPAVNTRSGVRHPAWLYGAKANNKLLQDWPRCRLWIIGRQPVACRRATPSVHPDGMAGSISTAAQQPVCPPQTLQHTASSVCGVEHYLQPQPQMPRSADLLYPGCHKG
jgi:hypothetical protein